jgi:hypothetical protein
VHGYYLETGKHQVIDIKNISKDPMNERINVTVSCVDGEFHIISGVNRLNASIVALGYVDVLDVQTGKVIRLKKDSNGILFESD